VNRLIIFLDRFSFGWVTLVALALLVIFSIFALPAQAALTEKYSRGLGSPDTSLFYTPDDLINMAETYGLEGRSAYLHARWNFDFAFPLIYTFFFMASIYWLFKKSFSIRIRSWLMAVPILTLLLDLAENSATSVVMSAFPIQDTWGESLAPLLTPLKWTAVAVCFFLVGVGLIKLLIQRYKRI
jgi:hypothetical protein